MSAPSSSNPSAWASVAAGVVTSLLGLAAQWGTLGSDVRNLDRRVTACEADVAQVKTGQASATAQTARIETRLDGMTAELTRLARGIERLAEGQPRGR